MEQIQRRRSGLVLNSFSALATGKKHLQRHTTETGDSDAAISPQLYLYLYTLKRFLRRPALVRKVKSTIRTHTCPHVPTAHALVKPTLHPDQPKHRCKQAFHSGYQPAQICHEPIRASLSAQVLRKKVDERADESKDQISCGMSKNSSASLESWSASCLRLGSGSCSYLALSCFIFSMTALYVDSGI